MNIIDNLLAALNKCETIKSHENVRYTLIDDELRSYIEDELEHSKELLDKEKPAVPILYEAEYKDTYESYQCPNCHAEVRRINMWAFDNYPYHDDSGKVSYCSECGQKLDWSDKYE